MEPALLEQLRDAVGGAVETEVSLDQISRWRIGGTARARVTASTSAEVQRVVQIMSGRPEPLLVIGKTSNLLFDSRGFDGVLLQLGGSLETFGLEGTQVLAGGASDVFALAMAAGEAGLTGIEHIVGIPGTLGGLVAMNGGTRRRGIGENILSIEVVTPEGELREVTPEQAAFAYRTTSFQDDRSVITRVKLQLQEGDRETILSDMQRIQEERAGKFPSDLPNCGSTFLSDPRMYEEIGPPGRAIEEAGLKGRRIGGAQISPLHANFINNVGGASSDDVLNLIALIQGTVFERSGYLMKCEVRYVSSTGKVCPASDPSVLAAIGADRSEAPAPVSNEVKR